MQSRSTELWYFVLRVNYEENEGLKKPVLINITHFIVAIIIIEYWYLKSDECVFNIQIMNIIGENGIFF